MMRVLLCRVSRLSVLVSVIWLDTVTVWCLRNDRWFLVGIELSVLVDMWSVRYATSLNAWVGACPRFICVLRTVYFTWSVVAD